MRSTPSDTGRVLVVEDEPALLRALQINLRARGYEVTASIAGREALAEAARRPPDAVLLDLGLPDMDGIEVIRELRTWSAASVIVLSGRASSGDKIGALDAGADDYVTKPFSMEELMARLRAALRRDGQHSGSTEFAIGRTQVDLSTRTVLRQPAGDQGAAETVHLTRTEWRMLEVLLQSAGQLVPAARLLTEVWGPEAEDRAHYLRFHMAKLRRKLEDDPPRPKHLLTEPGMGYRYQA
ncbi:MAG TPA: response regulator [Streptosporangiaceae bacterium]|nr:response regulator [Streptosporangiaceae bacterium]